LKYIAAAILAIALLLACLLGPSALKSMTRAPAVSHPAPAVVGSPPTIAISKDGAPIESPIRFLDVSTEAGLTIPHFNAADGRFRLVETMGSGVGLIDYDGDGWLDVFVANGCPLPRDPGQRRHTAHLYRNNRDGTFADMTESAGVGFNGYGQGVAVGDYDGDGRDDLYVSGFGRGALYHNDGEGRFSDATDRAGVAGSGWATSCAFADLDGDGDLDLYVVHYLANTVDDLGQPTARCNAASGNGYCPPTAFAPEPDVLYRNNGDGTFTDVSREAGIATPAGNGLGLAIADLDDDGRLDIFVANDQTPNFLFRNLGGLRFEEVALGWGLAFNEEGQARAGMGVAVGDADDDGRVDLLVTNFYEESSTLYRNVAPGLFQVATARARLAVPSRDKLGFGTGFLDADNDSRLDLFVANGHVNDVRAVGMPYAMVPQLFHNIGHGRFADVTYTSGDYFQQPWLGRGAAFGDLDNDGDTDFVVTHIGREPALLRNDSAPRGHYLRLKLIASGRSHSPVGARVSVQTNRDVTSPTAPRPAAPRVHLPGWSQTRVVAAGTSYLSASDPRVLFGLGTRSRVDRLEVRWPSGRVQSWTDLPADQGLEITEGSEPKPEPIAPPAQVHHPVR
jgi:hypothetical protein